MVAVLSFGWTPTIPLIALSIKTTTFLFSSFSIPKGVTDPGVKPNISNKSDSLAKLKCLVLLFFLNCFKSTLLSPLSVIK